MDNSWSSATPLIRLPRFGRSGHLFAKIESIQPSGSVYDRVADPMLRGLSGKIVVAGGGSACLAFAAAAVRRRLPLVVVCPASTLGEHRILLDQFPIEVLLSPAEEGLHGAHHKALEIAARPGHTLIFSPIHPEGAIEVFAASVGAELVRAFAAVPDPKPRALFVPFASGALIRGIQRALSQAGLDLALFATFCPERGITSAGASPERAWLPPGAELVEVTEAEAAQGRRTLAREEGLLAGMGSAGSAFAARRALLKFDSVAVVVVDAGDRYLSRDRAWSEA